MLPIDVVLIQLSTMRGIVAPIFGVIRVGAAGKLCAGVRNGLLRGIEQDCFG
jgi:hypothetical protein